MDCVRRIRNSVKLTGLILARYGRLQFLSQTSSLRSGSLLVTTFTSIQTKGVLELKRQNPLPFYRDRHKQF